MTMEKATTTKSTIAREGLRVSRPFVEIVFQRGLPQETGVNGCRVEDVIDVAIEQLQRYQQGPLQCTENAEAIEFLQASRRALDARKRRRLEQGVLNTMSAHYVVRTEDEHEDFSATGA